MLTCFLRVLRLLGGAGHVFASYALLHGFPAMLNEKPGDLAILSQLAAQDWSLPLTVLC